MEIFKKSLLENSPEPLELKPSELEHDDLSCFVCCGHNSKPVFNLKRSTKRSWEQRTKENIISLDLAEVVSIISKGTDFLQKIENGQIIQCSCGSYMYAGTEYCFICEKERARLWNEGGNELLRDYGYKPINEKSSN